jgi:uncharacterized membrane protein
MARAESDLGYSEKVTLTEATARTVAFYLGS